MKVITRELDQSVHLGPAWYIERHDTKVEKADKVEVKGSRVMLSGKPVVISCGTKKRRLSIESQIRAIT